MWSQHAANGQGFKTYPRLLHSLQLAAPHPVFGLLKNMADVWVVLFLILFFVFFFSNTYYPINVAVIVRKFWRQNEKKKKAKLCMCLSEIHAYKRMSTMIAWLSMRGLTGSVSEASFSTDTYTHKHPYFENIRFVAVTSATNPLLLHTDIISPVFIVAFYRYQIKTTTVVSHI